MNSMTCVILFSMTARFTKLLAGTDAEFQFEIDYRDYVTAWIGDITPENSKALSRPEFEYLTELPMEKRIDVCNAAKKFAGDALGGTDPITNVPLKSYEIHETVMECDTVPRSYLKSVETGEYYAWTILVNTNRFPKTHNFEVEKLTSKPISCSEALKDDPTYLDMENYQFKKFVQSTCFEDELVKKSHLVEKIRSPEALVHLCLAANETIKRQSSLRVPVLRNNDVKAPQMYSFKNMKRVAFECPSNPVTYIYFKTPRVNNDVQVLLVKGGSIFG